MATITTGSANLPAQAHRQQTALSLSPDPATPLSVLDGVHAGLNISKTTGMGFQVGPGRAAINGATPEVGPFTATVLSSEVNAFAPGDATLDRIDLVVLQTYPNADAAGGAVLAVVAGTPSLAPVAPPKPVGALVLYQVRIPAGTSSANGGWSVNQVTDRRRKIGMQDFVSYTPTFGNFGNLGAGALREGRYRVDGDKVTVNVHLKGGVGASMGTNNLLNFSLPIPAAPKWVYYGSGGLHHPDIGGLAYDLRIMANGGGALFFATTASGALTGPGKVAYPFGNGTDIYLNVEYVGDFGQ